MMDDITKKIQELNRKNLERFEQAPIHDTKTEDLVNEIYNALCAIFRGCWISKSQFEIDEYKKQLFLSLKQFGINNQEQIEMGLRNARAADVAKFPSTKTVVDWCLNNTNNDIATPFQSTFDDAYSLEWKGLSDEEKERKKELGRKSLSGILNLLKKG